MGRGRKEGERERKERGREERRKIGTRIKEGETKGESNKNVGERDERR